MHGSDAIAVVVWREFTIVELRLDRNSGIYRHTKC